MHEQLQDELARCREDLLKRALKAKPELLPYTWSDADGIGLAEVSEEGVQVFEEGDPVVLDAVVDVQERLFCGFNERLELAPGIRVLVGGNGDCLLHRDRVLSGGRFLQAVLFPQIEQMWPVELRVALPRHGSLAQVQVVVRGVAVRGQGKAEVIEVLGRVVHWACVHDPTTFTEQQKVVEF